MSNTLIKEALDNNWEDRIFMHYTNVIDPNASRPRDEYTKEWQEIIEALQKYITPEVPKKVVSKKPIETILDNQEEEII